MGEDSIAGTASVGDCVTLKVDPTLEGMGLGEIPIALERSLRVALVTAQILQHELGTAVGSSAIAWSSSRTARAASRARIADSAAEVRSAAPMFAPLRHASTIVAINDRAAVRASDRDTSDLPRDAHPRGLTARFYATSRSMLKVIMDRACSG